MSHFVHVQNVLLQAIFGFSDLGLVGIEPMRQDLSTDRGFDMALMYL
jgi:hypothetical protein